uniref:EF-hand domain-containing protein n=1 Tax=Steinernema glaseri TaxID=37863 RepID=A0A1I8AFI2_9BILA
MRGAAQVATTLRRSGALGEFNLLTSIREGPGRVVLSRVRTIWDLDKDGVIEANLELENSLQAMDNGHDKKRKWIIGYSRATSRSLRSENIWRTKKGPLERFPRQRRGSSSVFQIFLISRLKFLISFNRTSFRGQQKITHGGANLIS